VKYGDGMLLLIIIRSIEEWQTYGIRDISIALYAEIDYYPLKGEIE